MDDLNLAFGKVKLKAKGSAGGHNGLKDINQLIGSDYPRLRIGIGDDFRKGQQVDFVLGKWDKEEQEELPAILTKAKEVVKAFGSIGLAETMNQFNNK